MAEGKWRHANEHEATPPYRAAEQAVTKLRLNNAASWPSGIVSGRALPLEQCRADQSY
jgi:hypothetical protein